MIWFTSDNHFGHKNIIEYCKRPFADVHEMNEIMITRWNERVEDGDIVYHLGDLSFLSNDWTHSILKRLKGTIILIKGNHDRNWASDRITGIQWRLYTGIEGQMVHMEHKPQAVWQGMDNGAWQLHGHNHGMGCDYLPFHPRRVDVGVDCWNFYPVSIWMIAERLRRLEQERKQPKGV